MKNKKPIIEIDSISFSYPNEKRLILDRCSLDIQPGELISILGPNGAGKSTLLNCACGLLTPQEGDVRINGTSIRRLDQRSIARAVGYVQQTQHSAFSHSVFDYVLMGRASQIGMFRRPSEADRRRTAEVMEEMGIARLSDAAITEISGGERQQAAIARAVVQEPQVLFFDEPTAHLDYGNQIFALRMIAELQRKGFAVVMTTHNPDHCMILGGRVALLDREGHLTVGSTEEMLNEQTLSDVYHSNVHVVYVPEANRTVCIPDKI